MNDPYLNFPRCVKRLYNDFMTHRNLMIAFDFDDTVFDFHKKRFTYTKVIALLKEAQEMGNTLILFTGNEGENLEKAVAYCEELGLEVSYVNESPIMTENRKPFYNIFLDDRAGLSEAYNILKETIKRIKRRQRDDSTYCL
jgi:hypothetical protein